MVQCFGTTAERQGWNRPWKLPFVEASSSSAPGPGSYEPVKSNFRTQMRKRLINDPVAFDSTGVRPCLKMDTPLASRSATASRAEPGPMLPRAEPGPGDYDVGIQSIANMIKSKRNGHCARFGSRAARFDPHCLPVEPARFFRNETDNLGAVRKKSGPGAYDKLTARCRGLIPATFKPQLHGINKSRTKPLDTNESSTALQSDVLRIGAGKRSSLI